MLVRPVIVAAAFCAAASFAFAEDIRVASDHSQVVKLNAPARSVIIGNPMIAEVTLVDERTVYVLGRMVGQTNLVAVDKAGNEILNQLVSVQMGDQQIVTLHEGTTGPKTFSCAPKCEWMVNPGDVGFKEIHDAADKKQALSANASDLAAKQR